MRRLKSAMPSRRDARVRYVVEGSVRCCGSRVRVTAKLIGALNGKHLWAQHYDRELQGVFAIQDDVTSMAVLPARIEAAATEAAARKAGSRLQSAPDVREPDLDSLLNPRG